MKWLKKIGVILIGIVLAVVYSYRTWPVAIYDTNVDSSTYESVGELKDGATVEQSFLCEYNGLNGIDITANSLASPSDTKYHWKVQETNSGEIVGKGILTSNDIDNSQKIVLDLELQKNSKNKEYLFVIETEAEETEHGITIMKTKSDKNQDDNLVLNGTTQEAVLVLTQQIHYMNIETGIVFLGIYLYFVFFMRFLLKLFK